MIRWAALLLLGLIIGCKSSSDDNPDNPNTNGNNTIDLPLADYELLFMGNSHSSYNNLPGLVAAMLAQDAQNKTANAFNAPGSGFLSDRINDGQSYGFLQSRQWTHVILQAQKYSTTGAYTYPTTAAKTWIQRVKSQGAIAIMFPEWPRRGNFEEGQRVHDLHVSIAMEEPACVAPIGLAWDLAIVQNPSIELHANDGNHSNLTGALLSAFVFYGVITELPVTDLPYLDAIAVSESTQTFLKGIAQATLENNPPCLYLP